MIREAIALTRPEFALTEHLARSAEVSAFDLTTWMKPRQPGWSLLRRLLKVKMLCLKSI